MEKENRTKKTRNTREIEAALIIYLENPDQFIEEFAALTSIGRFPLIAEFTQNIDDTYFDTSIEELKKRGLALRLRKVGDKQLITLKGESKPTDWGGHNRLEIEQTWSETALVTILEELRKKKIQLSQFDKILDFSNSIQVLEKIGLQIIQQRTNQRRIRNIIQQDKSRTTVLAELSIDSVTYQFKHQKVKLHELEIESKSKDSALMFEEIILTLMKMYKSELKKWDHSKLATGKAIEKLLEEGNLDELLDDFNNLKPKGLDKIDSYIKSGNI